MDTKSQHCKHPKKMKSTKDKHEVFVLPPDLLKKLGISIGNINGSQDIPDDANSLPSTEVLHNDHTAGFTASGCAQKPSNTSILETASLMKKSVFLSPTFVPTTANTIAGELEISGKNTSENSFTVADFEQDSGFIPADGIDITKLLQNSDHIKKDCVKADLFVNTVNGEQTIPSNINQEYPCIPLEENEMHEEDINKIFDENIRELESKGSNGLGDNHLYKRNNNVEFILSSADNDSDCVSFNKDFNDTPAPKASKINIISEETIPLSKLKEIKRLSNVKKLTPVTIQTIIDTKGIIEERSSGLQSIIETNPTVPFENTKLHLDVFKSGENTNQTTFNSMNSNEHLETIRMPCGLTSEAVEEETKNITSIVIENVNILEDEQNVKDISNRTPRKLIDTDSNHLNVDNTNMAMGDCILNDQNKTSESNTSANDVVVNGFDRNEEIVTIDSDKSVMNCNGVIGEGTDPAVQGIKEIEQGCYRDHMVIDSPVQKASDIEKHSIIKENINKESIPKPSNQSKNTHDNDNRVKKLIKHKISSKKVEDKTFEDDELSSISNATKNHSSNTTDLEVDKVKEIAAYLAQIYTDKKKTKMAFSNDIHKKETINSNTNTIESKLCIQGVEKPGGIEADRKNAGENKILKTYARRNSLKTPKRPKLLLHKNETGKTVDELDLDLNSVNISTSCEMQEFCLCDDFGRLDYYDCDNFYEHIHFWHHQSTNCELDSIFAIYSDETLISRSEIELDQEEKTDDKIEAYNVCWNIFQSEFSENLDNADTELRDSHAIDELKDACSGASPQVPVLNNVAQKVDNGNFAKTHDKVQMKNNANSDIILETSDHDMVDTAISKNSDSIENSEKPLNTNISDAMSAAGSGYVYTGTCTSQPKLTASTEHNDAKEKTYQRKQSLSNENKLTQKEAKLESSKAVDKSATKRRLSGNATLNFLKNNDEPSSKKSIKCGLCSNVFARVDWDLHVANEHHLIAWRAGSSINLEDPELVQKLKERLKTQGVLECSLCSMHIKKFNRFIEHMKYCIRKKLSEADNKPDKPARKSRTVVDDNVTCAVCQRTMLASHWLEHIGSAHDYLAWKEGQEPINLENESAVWQHLQNIIRLNGFLICFKCGLKRSRVKLYLSHIKTCDGSGISVEIESPSIPKDNTMEEQAEPVNTTSITMKCGVCKQEVEHSDWIEHICKQHNYLAWEEGDTPLDLDEEEAVWNHLQKFIRQNGGLTCHKCGLVRKRVKLYLTHIETCDGTDDSVDNINTTTGSTDLDTTAKTDDWYEVPIIEERKIVKCGVCSEEIPILEWLQHIGKEHDYLAWQDGAAPLDLENELAVKVHLLEVSKQCGGLACNKCEKRMKYPKTYQQHIKECTGPTAANDSELDDSTTSWLEILSSNKIKDQILTCGVCADKVESDKWVSHIEDKHQYLAWVEGQPPLNLEDAAMVQRHLNDVSKMLGGLICLKCGVKRRYVKSYLVHVETCQRKVSSSDLPLALMIKDVVECAICAATMEPKAWRTHSMQEHYNIAWVVGDNPIEINNPYAVESYLKEYQSAKGKLICKVCGISRVSYVGFYAHIIVCGKSEQETEIYKSLCEICNNKYLRIYKSQHMTMHREKEYALERKLLAAKEKALKKEEEPVDVIQTGRRKAAEKAKNVIEKYKNNFLDGTYHCSKCGFNSEVEKELSEHVCVENKWGDVSDSDESVKLESASGDESDESDIDSNVSDEEQEAREQTYKKKKKYPESSAAKICRLPYQVENTSTYMKRSTEEFIETYLTEEDLFPQWHDVDFEEVPENEMQKYMPPIEESCKVRFNGKEDWVTFNRLESSRIHDTLVLFTGGSNQCMSWVPPPHARAPQFLSAAPHRAHDAPRLAWDCATAGPGLVQIWDCGNLIGSTPKLALGIAHDFGTVWSIDWCPSGARDSLDLEPGPNKLHRLGLLATACSNGSAYIFVVPYPTSITEKEKPFYKIKPVVELKVTSSDNRKAYQATAIKWSVQKGHSHVVVGYADGTTAYYDLNGDSPLLRSTENGRTIIFPYHDERVQNSCIEDVDVFPGGWGARGGGAVMAGGAGGAGAAALQSHVAVKQVLFPPHWPAALLAGDDCLVNKSINELEWWGGGRRLGGSRGAAGCAWCGRVVAAAPPLLRLIRPHPCFPEVHKLVIGRIMMVPFGGKRKRQNDELSMIVEPITYSDVVKKYGLEVELINSKDRSIQQKLSATPRDAYPERFPLSDVAALQFCPTFKLHQKLAIAMHAGLIFIINV